MNDEHIIQLYFARDEDAIQATQDKYGPYCSAIAHNILGDPREAEECVNDAWLHCWNAIPPQRPLSLKSYAGRAHPQPGGQPPAGAGCEKAGRRPGGAGPG